MRLRLNNQYITAGINESMIAIPTVADALPSITPILPASLEMMTGTVETTTDARSKNIIFFDMLKLPCLVITVHSIV